jgi:predicted O-methyltransferase YrrM
VNELGEYDYATVSEFVANIETSKNVDKIFALQSDSAHGLAVLTEMKQEFDLILIDGSHLMLDVLHDALLAFDLLKVGGTLVFDDYGCNPWSPAHGRTKEGIDAFVQVHRASLQDIFYYPASPVQVVSFVKIKPAPRPVADPLDQIAILVNAVVYNQSPTGPSPVSFMAVTEEAESFAHWVVGQAGKWGAPVTNLEVVNRVGRNTTQVHAGAFAGLAVGKLHLPPGGMSTEAYLARRVAQFDRRNALHDIILLSASRDVDARAAMHNLMGAMYLLRVGGYIVIDNAELKDRYPSNVPEQEQAWFGYNTVLTSAEGKLFDITDDAAMKDCTSFRVFRYTHNRFRLPNLNPKELLSRPTYLNMKERLQSRSK